jgi:hypothetical protein
MNGSISVASLALTNTIGAGGLSQTSANTAGNAGGLTTVVTGGSFQLSQAYGGGAGGGSSLGAGGGGGSIGGGLSSGIGNAYSSLVAAAGTYPVLVLIFGAVLAVATSQISLAAVDIMVAVAVVFPLLQRERLVATLFMAGPAVVVHQTSRAVPVAVQFMAAAAVLAGAMVLEFKVLLAVAVVAVLLARQDQVPAVAVV